MAARYDCSDSGPSSLPPPFPKSPPDYPDLYGKRRETAKIQVLEREIGYLEAELKSADSLQPASRSCKEIVDSVAANSDPLIPTFKKNPRRYHRFRKWLCGLPRFYLSRIHCCCYSGCAFQVRTPLSCHFCNFGCNWNPSCPADCLSCALPECLRLRPTTPNCLSCALPEHLQCRPTPLNCLSCALPKSLQWQLYLCCSSCPDLCRCKNRHSFVPDCSFPKCKCSCYYCPECPINPSCCLSFSSRRSCCNCSRYFNLWYLCA